MNAAGDKIPTLLLVDDDAAFREVLGDALRERGFRVQVAHNVDRARELAAPKAPQYAVVDLKMPGASGLELIKHLITLDPRTRIVVLTAYASITTAVEAIKLGATHYLAKPTDADEIVAAFHKHEGDSGTIVGAQTLSTARLEWEHIQRVLAECRGNVSETARRLHMHRRTLQRKLAKRPTRV